MSGYLTITTPGLPAEIAGGFRFKTDPTYGPDGQFDGVVVTSAVFAATCSEQALRSAIAVLEQAARPGGTMAATRALSYLRAKTATRAGGLADQHITGKAYAEALAEYPADIIDAACNRWADGSKWWPAWAELKQECDRMAAKRRAEYRALKDALARLTTPPRPQLAGPQPLPTLQERLRTSVVLRRQAGDTRTAARHEVELARVEGREPEQWASDAIAEQLAEQAAAAEAYRRLAEEAAAPVESPTTDRLAELAQQRRDRILGARRDEAAA